MLAERHVAVLAEASGLPLASFRREFLQARVEEAISSSAAGDPPGLGERLARSAPARAAFRRSVAISHTGFFRDAQQFAVLGPALAALHGRRRIRVWSAGCANGLELWSVAVLLQRRGLLARSRLLGSDLLAENVAEARRGDAARAAAGVLPPARPQFEQRDIVGEGAPVGHFDAVLCRNVGIYLDVAARERLHAVVCGAVAPGGVLLLGRSERLAAPAAHGMERVAPQLYRRVAA